MIAESLVYMFDLLVRDVVCLDARHHSSDLLRNVFHVSLELHRSGCEVAKTGFYYLQGIPQVDFNAA